MTTARELGKARQEFRDIDADREGSTGYGLSLPKQTAVGFVFHAKIKD